MAIDLTNIENEYNRIQTAKSDIATSMNNAGSDVSATNTMDEIALAVSNTTTELRAVAGQLTPNFANNIDELTGGGDTSKLYVLPDGLIYAFMYEEETGTTPNFTNQIPISKDTNGNVYNSVGYKNDTRLNSSKAEATLAGASVSGYIPISNGDIVRISKGLVKTNSSNPSNGSCNVVLYNSSFTALSAETVYQFFAGTTGLGFENIVKDDENYLTQFTINSADAKYLRITFTTNISDIDTQIVTVNEEITYTTSEGGYRWKSTGHSFVPADYEDRIIELEEVSEQCAHDIDGLEDRITTLESSDDVSLPDYWAEHVAKKADKIQQAMEKAGRNKSAFLWYTDAHWVSGNSKMSPALLNYLYRNTPMNKVNFGGDIIGDTLLATRDEMKYLYEWRKAIKDLPNHHSVLGNHDMFASDTVDYEDDNYRYAFMIAPEETSDMVMGEGNYYYIDNPCEKTRYLYFSYLTSGHTAMMAQGQFMVDAIKGVPEGWHIVAIAHRWWQYSSTSTPTTGSIPAFETDMLSVFDAYNARTTRGGSNYFTAQDFTEAKGKVEFCIAGHIHVDYDIKTAGGIPIIITTADANQNRVPDSTVDSGTVGTTTESAVFGIVADYNDPENTKITVVGVGRGTSRIIYEDQETVVVTPTQIYDLTYQLGDVEVGSTIDISQISYMVSYSDGTESEGGSGTISVSPTIVQSVGNNEITVTYTENGISVNGTLFINGIKAVATNLFNKDDADVVDTGRFNSSNVAVAFQEGQLVTGYIEAKIGDTFTISSDKSQLTNGYTGAAKFYDANKTVIAGLTNPATAQGGWTWASDNLSGVVTIPSSYGNNSFEGTAYVRFCIAYTDINNISITKS